MATVQTQVTENSAILADTGKQKKADSTHVKVISKKGPLNSKVDYHARDSIRLDAKKRKVYLYGDADVKYEDLELKAAYIDISLDSNIAYARGIKDSNKTIGKPEFHQGSEVFHANEIRYNFRTKKGRINQITTKEGEGYIQGQTVKKDSINVFYMKNGIYTTCSQEADPHFYIAATRLKVIPNDQVVTGPAMLFIEGVPTPLATPFGFFPLANGRHSGIVIPAYGESQSQGFFLQGGGYYLGLSDHFDNLIKGDIYTNGSWAAYDVINYDERYHYNGVLKVQYSDTRLPIQDSVGFTKQNNFLINWQHSQDPKARPNSTFSASVNAGSSNAIAYTSYNPSEFLNNTLQSNIAFTQNFPQTPFHLSLNAEHEQNTQTQVIDITLPELTFTADRMYPAKLFESTPVNNKWYSIFNTLSISFSTNGRNTVSTTQSEFTSLANITDKMQNGFNTSIPVSWNFTLDKLIPIPAFKYINIGTQVTGTMLNYFEYTKESWNTVRDTFNVDTARGFETALTYNTSVTASTNVYAMYTLGLKKSIMIRQVFYPSVSFTYHPDFSAPGFGYYRTIEDLPQYSPYASSRYSIFQEGIFGGPTPGVSRALGLSLGTNLEMKVRMQTDSGVIYKKIVLLERLTISASYNMAADSFNWSPITLVGNTSLFKKKVMVNFTGNIDPYQTNRQGYDIDAWDFYQNVGIFDIPFVARDLNDWNLYQSIGRVTSASLTLSTTLSSSSGQNKTQGNSTATPTTPGTIPSTQQNTTNSGLQLSSPSEYLHYEQFHPAYWEPVEIAPWSLTMNYILSYAQTGLASTTTQTVMFNGSMQISRYWYASVTSGYDISTNQFTSTMLSARRDMHCWELSFQTIPFGYHQMFSLTVHVKSSTLQDLKLQRQRSWTDTQQYTQ
ncbi:MAG: putative LPS assembly protein LptD [Bacteroidia bacterium]